MHIQEQSSRIHQVIRLHPKLYWTRNSSRATWYTEMVQKPALLLLSNHRSTDKTEIRVNNIISGLTTNDKSIQEFLCYEIPSLIIRQWNCGHWDFKTPRQGTGLGTYINWILTSFNLETDYTNTNTSANPPEKHICAWLIEILFKSR